MTGRRAPTLFALALLGGCLPKANPNIDSTSSCISALEALDGDGDLYLPLSALPKSCDLSWEDAVALLSEDGYQTGDCDDGDAGIHPGAEDVCGDDIDQDCDGAPRQISTWYTDADGDGFGDAASTSEACDAPAGTVDNGDDCDDLNPEISPDVVETACADDVDSDCDGVTDCAIVGAMNEAMWSALGVTESLGDGAGRAMDADEEGRVLVGGDNGAWLVTGDGRQVEVEAITIDGAVEAGAAVCLLDDVDDDGITEIVVGDPGYSDGVGRVSIGYSGGDEGSFTSDLTALPIGKGLEGEEGLLIVEQFLVASWHLYFIGASDLPTGGSANEITTFTETSVGAAGSADAPPALSIATTTDGWLVAAGQPEEDSGNRRTLLYNIADGHASAACYVTATDDATTLGTSILLADVTGDGAVDLIVGAPGDTAVYIFNDAATCAGTLTPDDASATITLAPVTDFGGALAAVPDLNGDGIDELLISGDDAVVLVLGGPDGLSPTATLSGPAGFGASISGADVDGDGFGDLIIGATERGEITILWGGP